MPSEGFTGADRRRGEDRREGAVDELARALLEQHVTHCAERQQKAAAILKDLAESVNTLHSRINGILRTLLVTVLSVAGTAILGVCALVFYLITKGSTP